MKKFILMSAAVLSLGATSLAGAASAAPLHAGHIQQTQVQSRFGGNDRQSDSRQFGRFNGPDSSANQHRDWRRGDRLPQQYRRMEVRDWRAMKLRAPPRGYHYVRVGNDVILASIASGLIGAVIANAISH